MGLAMAPNLQTAGFAISGCDTDAARGDELSGEGVDIRPSAAAAARDADFVLTSLPSVAALDDTVATLLAAPRRGLIVIETSTLPLEAKEAAHDRLMKAGIVLLDCPLSGTGAQAATRDLAVYASGDEPAYNRCGEVFAGIARVTHYLGPFGNG